MPNNVIKMLNNLLTHTLPHVNKTKQEVIKAAFEAAKAEFPDAPIGGRRAWTEAQKADARVAWQAKRAVEKFYIRAPDGKVREVLGIDNVAQILHVREASIRCYLSSGNGVATVKRSTVSKNPLLPVSALEMWDEQFFAKHGRWPNPADNPHDGAERRY